MNESLKHRAAVRALEEVSSGMVLGLGTGSTARHFIQELGARVREGLDVSAVATSLESERLAEEVGVRVRTFKEHKFLDLTVDGADEVSPELDLVKGLGGALVREKIVARRSRRLVIVVDESKLVEQLGTQSPIPVEVIPFAREIVTYELSEIGGVPRVRAVGDKPFVSDNGNHIIDWEFGPVAEAQRLEARLKAIPGVVDSGIFAGLADRVIVAGASGLRVLDRT